MKQLRILTAAAAVSGLLLGAAPAMAADLCLRFDGVSCPLSGDLGFFRFLGAKLPSSNKKATRLHGRACGTGTATGTAVTNAEGNQVNLSATFVCDGTPGLINASFAIGAGIGAVGSGDSEYGSFGLNDSCDVIIVECVGEPGMP